MTAAQADDDFRYACDNDKQLQKHLVRRGLCVFRNVEDLVQHSATMLGETPAQNATKLVPLCDKAVAGFVCASFSKLNANRSSHINCVRNATGKSGESLSMLMDYLLNSQPIVVVIENVLMQIARV